jgi:endonuclease/exonuclease/phosphatase family metal-dependent hydrolase
MVQRNLTTALAFFVIACTTAADRPSGPRRDADAERVAPVADAAVSEAVDADRPSGPQRDAGSERVAPAADAATAPEVVDAAHARWSKQDAEPESAGDDTGDAGVDLDDKGCIDDADGGTLFSLSCPRTQRCSSGKFPAATIRVASWNIKVGEVQGLAAVVNVLREVGADIVLLQEVDVTVQRSGDVDQVRAIADELGYQSTFAPTVALEGGLYGIAMLSRVAFQSVVRVPLTNLYAGEPRTAIEAEFCWGALRVVNHHADYMPAGAEESVIELLDVATASSAPTLFAGDFDQIPSDRGPQACVQADLRDVLADLDPAPTFGDRRIDYVFANKLASSMVQSARVVPTDASDHALLVVDLRLAMQQ